MEDILTEVIENSDVQNLEGPILLTETSSGLCDCEQIPTSLVSQSLYSTKNTSADALRNVEVSEQSANEKTSTNSFASSPVSKKLKCETILSIIEKDVKAADLKLSSYMTACLEIKNGLQIHPFPPTYCSTHFSNQSRLLDANEEIPSIVILKRSLEGNNYDFYKDDVISTLFWLFVSLKEPKVSNVPVDEFHSIISVVYDNQVLDKPSYIYSLSYSDDSRLLRKWNSYKTEYPSKFGFMYIDPEFLHSLIHEGLRFIAGLNGPGVILSEDLNYIVGTAPVGWYWPKSGIGCKLRVVCLVEFLDHPSVLVQKKKAVKKTSLPNTSNGDDKEFYVITDPTTGVVRYVMLYGKSPSLGCDLLLDQKTDLAVRRQNVRNVFTIVFVISLIISTLSFLGEINLPNVILNFFKKYNNIFSGIFFKK